MQFESVDVSENAGRPRFSDGRILMLQWRPYPGPTVETWQSLGGAGFSLRSDFLNFEDLIRRFDPMRLPCIRGRPAPFSGRRERVLI